jgi:hypothetical protein
MAKNDPNAQGDPPSWLDPAQVSIQPPQNDLTLNPGQTITETIVVTIPPSPVPIQNVKMVPTGAIVPFVTSITPAGTGPLAPNVAHTVKFEVTFTGTVPCKDQPQFFSGLLQVVATLEGQRDVVIARKPVRVTVPECEPVALYSYSVKFVCGVQDDCSCGCAPVRPGAYATEINIFNPHPKEAALRKHVVPVVFAGSAVGREPRFAEVKANDKIVLPPRTATMDDCCRIAELLLGAAPGGPLPLTIGFLEIVTNQELAVSAVYTASDAKSGSLSIDVEQVRPIRVR